MYSVRGECMCVQCEGGVHVCTTVLMCVMHLCACVCDKCDVIGDTVVKLNFNYYVC